MARSIRVELVKTGEALGSQAGSPGKTVSVSGSGDSVSIDVYALMQGDDADTTNDTLRTIQGYFRSSNGGLLGNLSVALTSQFSDLGSTPGASGDVDSDTDTDIGGAEFGSGHFIATTGTGNYGFGAAAGYREGTITAGALGLTGNDLVYAKIATLTFDVTGSIGTTDIQFTPRDVTGSVSTFIAQGRDSGTNFNVSDADRLTIGLGAPVSISVIPEPSSIALAGFGLVGLAYAIRRRKAA